MRSQMEKFLQYLDEKGKKQTYISTLGWRLKHIYDALQIQPTSSHVIDNLVRSIWSGYAGRDKTVYRFLNDYANFCEADYPEFTAAFHEHVCDTFEGEARKAMRAYKNTFVYIPEDTTIASYFLEGLTNNQFVNAFKSLQEVVYAIYDDIERSSPFDWGLPDWQGITGECFDHTRVNRVMMILNALVSSSRINDNILVVDKTLFGRHAACKPATRVSLFLKGLVSHGFHMEKYDIKESSVFTVSYPDIPNLMTVLFSYFKERPDGQKNHVHVFSYRFVENPAVQTHETFFLAKTDGEPKELRDIYYWNYSEAVKHGFLPQGREVLGCYQYKKGTKEWLLLGNGHSYHEEDFLHSPPYAIAVKVCLPSVFRTHPQLTNELKKKFPNAFKNSFSNCRLERTKNCGEMCKMRIITIINNREHIHCGRNTLYFHDPTFDDVKMIYELYKLENSITS